MVTLGFYIENYVSFLQTDEGRRWLAEGADNRKFFQSMYSEEAIEHLTETDFYSSMERIQSLPQVRAISVARDLVAKYGMKTLAQELNFFIRGQATIEVRFDEIRMALAEMPQVMFMEIGMFSAPREHCVWDENARRAIVFVGHSRMHSLTPSAFGETIDGFDYVASKTALNHVKESIRAYRREKIDFVDAWLFSRFMCERIIPPSFTYPKT